MLEVSFFGQFEVLHDGTRLTIPTRNAQALFAYLLINAGKMHRREQLAGMLWPDSSEENARSNLRHELWRLRKVVETVDEPVFVIDDLAIAFRPHGEFFFDVNKLEKPLLEKSTIDDLINSLSAYRGELLPGFYEEWIFVERNRLHALFEAKMTRLLDMLQREGRWPEVLDWGMRWVAVEQWSEPAYRALISAYANSGDLSKAAATYERFSQGIQKDLGVKPSEQTQALFKRLKAGWRTDVVQKEYPTSGFPLKAYGNDKGTPSPTSAQATTSPTFSLPGLRRSNLPRPLTSFIGREKEIRWVEHLVARARLVTITGPGGVGKTRLAIQAASALTPLFKDGAWWTELASLFETTTSPKGYQSPETVSTRVQKPRLPSKNQIELVGAELVAQAVTKALRVSESPGLTPLEGVLGHLGDKELLLVLDNCEHLVEACATMVERMLDDCPNVVILATSREALQVPGEIAWILPSLSLPRQNPSADFRYKFQSEAVSLFIERAAGVLPDYQPDELETSTIAQICLRLDGIPLAIELAAARVNLLSVQEIAARLDTRFSILTNGHRTALPRHQTLWDAIEWSYDLLNDPERILFRRLSIFATSFDLEAAESICGDREIRKDEVLTLLGRLVNKSLLHVEPAPQGMVLPTRYHFLDTICSYARLKLDEADETSWMHDRHTHYYVCLAETAEPELLSREQIRWFVRLQAENDNFRAVVEWTTESNQPENALRLVGALMWYWFSNGSSREGRDLCFKALALPPTNSLKEYRAKALNTAGLMQCYLGDLASARDSLEEALSILRISVNETSLAWTLQLLGLVFAFDGKFDLADAAIQEGLSITQKLGGIHNTNFLHFLGDIEMQKGDRIKAKETYTESADILRSIGSKSFLAYPLRRLGYLALEENDLSSAREYFKESLLLNQEVGDKRALIACLISISKLAIRLDEPILAAQLYGAAESMLESFSIFLHYTDQADRKRLHSELLTSLDEVTFTTAFSEGREMGEEQALAFVGEI